MCAVKYHLFLSVVFVFELLLYSISIRSEIFTQLMMMLERWYLAGDEEHVDYSNRAPRSNGKLVYSVPFVSPDHASADSRNELIIKLRSIMNDILAVIDPAMHQHLSKLKILPQTYGMLVKIYFQTTVYERINGFLSLLKLQRP